MIWLLIFFLNYTNIFLLVNKKRDVLICTKRNFLFIKKFFNFICCTKVREKKKGQN